MRPTRLLLAGLACLACLAGSSTAFAGGVGLLASGGVHQAKAYYYTTSGDQGIDAQLRPNYGYGIQALLGDKDDSVQGVLRLYSSTDLPPNDPDTGEYTDAAFPAASEQDPAVVGVMTVGMQWHLFGDPAGFQVVLDTLGGSAFATTNNLEYAILDVGVGVTYALNETLQLNAGVSMAGRYRKGLTFTENGVVGVRYMFD